MTLNDVQFMFNRALVNTFDKRKTLIMFTILVLCGVLVVFFRGLSLNAGYWVGMSLTFLPIFLITGVLLSTGIFLIRIYHDEVKNRPVSYGETLKKSWDVVLGASYFSIPFILTYLLLWMLLGVFMLLSETPGVGVFFGVILSFAPFLLNVGSLFLCLLNISMLFFVSPVVALRGLNRLRVSQIIVKRLQSDIFTNILLGVIGSLPLLGVLSVLSLAAVMTGTACLSCDNSLSVVLQWFFVMIPFTALLAPAVIFFFNFAAEAHVMSRNRQIVN